MRKDMIAQEETVGSLLYEKLFVSILHVCSVVLLTRVYSNAASVSADSDPHAESSNETSLMFLIILC